MHYKRKNQTKSKFKAMIGEMFVPLIGIDNSDSDVDINDAVSSFNTAMIETASDILGQHWPRKKPWVTADILDLCDKKENGKSVKARKKVLNSIGR